VLGTLGKPSSLKEIVPDRPGHDRRYLLDSTKIRRLLEWEPAVPFAEAPEAHRILAARENVGKVVLVP